MRASANRATPSLHGQCHSGTEVSAGRCRWTSTKTEHTHETPMRDGGRPGDDGKRRTGTILRRRLGIIRWNKRLRRGSRRHRNIGRGKLGCWNIRITQHRNIRPRILDLAECGTRRNHHRTGQFQHNAKHTKQHRDAGTGTDRTIALWRKRDHRKRRPQLLQSARSGRTQQSAGFELSVRTKPARQYRGRPAYHGTGALEVSRSGRKNAAYGNPCAARLTGVIGKQATTKSRD